MKCNGLEEGQAGPREMSKLELAKRKDSDSAFEDLWTILTMKYSSGL